MLSRDVEAYDAYSDRTAPDECPVCGVDCRCSGPYVDEDVASAVIAATHADRWLDARGNLIAELAKHVDDGEAMDRIVKLADAYAEVRK